MHIGIDLMGSDSPPALLYEAVKKVAQEIDPAKQTLVVFATPEWEDPSPPSGVVFYPVSEVIEMDDTPLFAARRKRDSSMAMAVELLRAGELDGIVSAGNTGALIALTTLGLERLPGVERPALLALLPTEKGSVAILDVGGHIHCRPEHLVQFAEIGSTYQRIVAGVTAPKIGLLNIGEESGKGTSEQRLAHDLLSKHFQEKSEISFYGNVEGREVYQGAVDVLVTNGFAGNIFLKASEGVSSFILEHLEGALKEGEANHALADLRRNVDYAEYPGAIVCGVDGVVVKCHGYSNRRAIVNGIRGAIRLVDEKFIEQMKS